MSLPRAALPTLALTTLGLLAPPAPAPAAFSVATQASPSFGLTLDGTDQTGVSTLVVRVTQTDAGANGKTGWNLTIDSTPLESAGGAQLAPDATSLVSGGYTCAVGPCTNPVNTVGPPLAIPAGSPPPPAVKVFNAGEEHRPGRLRPDREPPDLGAGQRRCGLLYEHDDRRPRAKTVGVGNSRLARVRPTMGLGDELPLAQPLFEP